ncbi:MAG: NfeD family protein [Candidatus Thorarchaeota archaeon]
MVSARIKFIVITVDEMILVPLAWVLVYFFIPELFVMAIVIGVVGSIAFIAIKYYLIYPVLQDGSYKLYDLKGVHGKVSETVTSSSGKIKVGQEIWDARSEYGELSPGSEVTIESRESFTVHVAPRTAERF